MDTKKRKPDTIPDREDKTFSLIAEKRLKIKSKKLTHSEVWRVASKRA